MTNKYIVFRFIRVVFDTGAVIVVINVGMVIVDSVDILIAEFLSLSLRRCAKKVLGSSDFDHFKSLLNNK
jgi:hypothetical protein